MLKAIVLITGWIALSLSNKVFFALTISALCIALLRCLMGISSPILGWGLTSLYTRTEIRGAILAAVRIWITAMMLLVRLKYRYKNSLPRSFNTTTILLLIIVIVFFLTDNLLVFYVSFEASLFPTLILILKWGYQPERLQAGLYFLMYNCLRIFTIATNFTKPSPRHNIL